MKKILCLLLVAGLLLPGLAFCDDQIVRRENGIDYVYRTNGEFITKGPLDPGSPYAEVSFLAIAETGGFPAKLAYSQRNDILLLLSIPGRSLYRVTDTNRLKSISLYQSLGTHATNGDIAILGNHAFVLLTGNPSTLAKIDIFNGELEGFNYGAPGLIYTIEITPRGLMVKSLDKRYRVNPETLETYEVRP